MGDLSFAKPFNMLVTGKGPDIVKQLHANMKSIGLFSHLTWLFQLFKKIPGLNAEHIKFWRWIGRCVEEKKKVNVITITSKIPMLIPTWKFRIPQSILMCCHGFSRHMTRVRKPSRILLTSQLTQI